MCCKYFVFFLGVIFACHGGSCWVPLWILYHREFFIFNTKNDTKSTCCLEIWAISAPLLNKYISSTFPQVLQFLNLSDWRFLSQSFLVCSLELRIITLFILTLGMFLCAASLQWKTLLMGKVATCSLSRFSWDVQDVKFARLIVLIMDGYVHSKITLQTVLNCGLNGVSKDVDIHSKSSRRIQKKTHRIRILLLGPENPTLNLSKLFG